MFSRLRPAVALGVPALIVLPAVLVACAPAPDTISLSTSPARTAAVTLANASVTGNAYVFVPKANGISAVSFYLDGRTTPMRTDRAAPWDLVGSNAAGASLPYDTSRLAAGLHRLTARISRGTAVTSVTSYFSVKRTTVPTPSVTAPTSPTTTPPRATTTASTIPTPTTTTTTTFTRTAGRPWSSTSPFNTPLPSNAVLDANSASIASYLGGGTRQQVANLYEYGWPVYDADAGTPRASVAVTENWGTNPFANLAVPMPTGMQANSGSDGHAAVIDWSTGRVFEFWQLKKIDATHWTASWGQVTPNVFTGIGNERIGSASSKGSGMSGLAGLVRAREIRTGTIDHALEFSSDAVTPSAVRFPANKTDGSNGAGLPLNMTIPEGGRVRLDPTVNLNAIPGITRAELAVGKALQKYGAFCSDQGGARMAFGFENPMGDPAGDPYPSAGFAWDYYHMSHIPWNKLQVLRQWDGH
ncbi:MAG: hypothetical protein QOJ32_717 [Frankiaceae bacterium]|nr:hypothetical protein [Frankiaceae bacterium]